VSDRPFVVQAKFGVTKRFKTFGEAKRWPLDELERSMKQGLKYDQTYVNEILDLKEEIANVLRHELRDGVAVTGLVAGYPVGWTFWEET